MHYSFQNFPKTLLLLLYYNKADLISVGGIRNQLLTDTYYRLSDTYYRPIKSGLKHEYS